MNLAIVAGFLLWQVRKDFLFHPIIIGWLILTFFSAKAREKEKAVMLFVGKVNGMIILSVFYFLIFSPFSVFYRLFFRHGSFRKSASTFEIKDSISPFDRPF